MNVVEREKKKPKSYKRQNNSFFLFECWITTRSEFMICRFHNMEITFPYEFTNLFFYLFRSARYEYESLYLVIYHKCYLKHIAKYYNLILHIIELNSAILLLLSGILLFIRDSSQRIIFLSAFIFQIMFN